MRNKKGGRYPATSLRDIFQGIGYHLKVVLRRGWRIFNDSEFSLSRTSLDAAMKEANSLGVRSQGSGPSDAVSKIQEEYLWDREVLGDTSPEVLLRTIFFCCGKFFGLRGGREHRDLEFGKHIKLSQTERGETLVYSNSYSKNFTGGLKQSSLKPKTVKIFPCIENPKRCFVRLYKLYVSKRPSNCKSTAFYERLRPKRIYSDDVWYDDLVVGHNSLDNMMKTIASLGNLKGNFTNHSLKKTTGQCLKDMSEVQKRSHTGNRSRSQSVYEQVDDEDFASTSAALYGQTSDPTMPATEVTTKSTSIPVTRNINFNEQNLNFNEVNLSVTAPPSKQLKMEVNAEKNIISFHFF